MQVEETLVPEYISHMSTHETEDTAVAEWVPELANQDNDQQAASWIPDLDGLDNSEN